MKISKLFADFFKSEKASGFILIGCTLFSLAVTNSSWGVSYISFWNIQTGNHTLTHWINDGLMAIFFLLVGLEIEREIYIGELQSIRNAMLPVCAAAGGIIIPALIHFLFNRGTPEQNGFGIPMATDIAFALGILSLAGKRVPPALKIFLTALAIIDDLGAILIIALFYTSTISWTNLLIALAIFISLLIIGRLKVYNLLFYLIPGVAMWYFMLQSGVHATISGVLLAFAIPFGKGDERSTSAVLQHFLHKPVAFIVIPLFALANTCILFVPGIFSHLTDQNSLGIMLGLLIGKPVGIFLFSWLAILFGIGRLQDGVRFRHLLAAGILGGIGFTMSIFISLLAFSDEATIAVSKISVLLASLVAGVGGLTFLFFIKPADNQDIFENKPFV
ncbi:MAG: Na+/H+ antiporter NhaA [Bacteroidetes bacterium]|nr:Na+/H+ antiporter NhaA [Bacteroidota bacterium]